MNSPFATMISDLCTFFHPITLKMRLCHTGLMSPSIETYPWRRGINKISRILPELHRKRAYRRVPRSWGRVFVHMFHARRSKGMFLIHRYSASTYERDFKRLCRHITHLMMNKPTTEGKMVYYSRARLSSGWGMMNVAIWDSRKSLRYTIHDTHTHTTGVR